eukprot:TRINITY_DN44810_c0_g1_i1.p1 TRINITY_DN44810_c0_g1~~TRINITY_DN44810_c0_g1_i1.p1  ORF type:complete len:477 (-),score=7.04 TRINITY_DN44810_c0_g1_i1:635-2065(-)
MYPLVGKHKIQFEHSASNFHVNKLPREVLLDIFRRVHQTDRVTCLPLVCKQWYLLLRIPSQAWVEFTFAPTFLRYDSGRQLMRRNAAKDAINYYKFTQWLRQRVAGMKTIWLSDRFGSNENCKRMYDALLNNLPYAQEVQCICLAFQSPLVMTYFLPRAQEYLQKLESLKLETWNLTQYPEKLVVLTQFQNLRCLTIGSLYGYGDDERQPVLDGFPIQVLGLTALEELSIRSRGVTAIPRQIASLQKLKVLNMEGCLVSQLPGSMINMIYLREINLSKNRIHDRIDDILDVVFAISSLEKIDLSSNQLTEIPMASVWFDTAAVSSRITHINISRNFLKQLPTNFSWFQSLKVLDLSRNLFEQIPSALLKLRNLQQLDLTKNIQLRIDSGTRSSFLRMGCEVLVPHYVFDNEIRMEEEDWINISAFAQEAASYREQQEQARDETVGLFRSISRVVSTVSSLPVQISKILPRLDIEWI